MPSLKLSNPFRRGADRPSLKDRAASLKATASRAMKGRPTEPAASANPDAGLLALGIQWRAARAAYDAADKRVSKIEAAYTAEPSDALYVQRGDVALGISEFANQNARDGRGWYWSAASDSPLGLGLGPNSGCFRHSRIRTVNRPALQARLDEICAAYDQYKREAAEEKASLGLEEAEASARHLFQEESALETAIFAQTACTLPGLSIQAQVAVANEDHQERQEMAWAIVRNLAAMA